MNGEWIQYIEDIVLLHYREIVGSKPLHRYRSPETILEHLIDTIFMLWFLGKGIHRLGKEIRLPWKIICVGPLCQKKWQRYFVVFLHIFKCSLIKAKRGLLYYLKIHFSNRYSRFGGKNRFCLFDFIWGKITSRPWIVPREPASKWVWWFFCTPSIGGPNESLFGFLRTSSAVRATKL